MKNTCQHFYRTAHFNASALSPGRQRCFRCTCKAVRHVHVGQYDMYMWDSITCTCKTKQGTEKKNVPFRERQSTTPGKDNNIV